MFGNLTLHSPGTTEKYHIGTVYKKTRVFNDSVLIKEKH